MSDQWATFDCYGTLIDWMGGIRRALADVWPDADADRLLARYHEIEPDVQAGRGIAYRQVMAEVLARIATAEGLVVPPGREDALGTSLPTWPPFPETRDALETLRSEGWRIGILSNTDPDFLDASLALIGVPVDERVVASEIG
jgi:2-haloacid dehalogenase